MLWLAITSLPVGKNSIVTNERQNEMILDVLQKFKIIERKRMNFNTMEDQDWGWYGAVSDFELDYVVVEVVLKQNNCMVKRTKESEKRKWATPLDVVMVYDQNGKIIFPANKSERERVLAVEDAVQDMDEKKLRDLGLLEE